MQRPACGSFAQKTMCCSRCMLSCSRCVHATHRLRATHGLQGKMDLVARLLHPLHPTAQPALLAMVSVRWPQLLLPLPWLPCNQPSPRPPRPPRASAVRLSHGLNQPHSYAHDGTGRRAGRRRHPVLPMAQPALLVRASVPCRRLLQLLPLPCNQPSPRASRASAARLSHGLSGPRLREHGGTGKSAP